MKFQFLIGWLQTSVVLSGENYLLSCFNSSQVGYKRPQRCRGLLFCGGVSIPHRLATNPAATGTPIIEYSCFNSSQVGYKLSHELTREALRSFSVSIPHRLATNNSSIARKSPLLTGFNSSQVGYKLWHPHIWKWIAEYLFQFLIGWLQTLASAYLEMDSRILVSIPHRLATNKLRHLVQFHLLQSFNSSQVGYKLKRLYGLIEEDEQFQFLIGWLQTEFDLSYQIFFSVCFNSSQVGYKLTRQSRRIRAGGEVSIPHRLATN